MVWTFLNSLSVREPSDQTETEQSSEETMSCVRVQSSAHEVGSWSLLSNVSTRSRTPAPASQRLTDRSALRDQSFSESRKLTRLTGALWPSSVVNTLNIEVKEILRGVF